MSKIRPKAVAAVVACALEVVTERIDGRPGQPDLGFKNDVRLTRGSIEEAPVRLFEQLVDLDAGLGFFCAQFTLASSYSNRVFIGRNSVIVAR